MKLSIPILINCMLVPVIYLLDRYTLEKQKVRIGEVYLYKRLDGSYAIHRVYSTEKDFVFMLGDAQLYIEKVHKSCLVAIVSEVQKPEKTVDCMSVSVRRKNIIRMKRRVFNAKCKSNLRCFKCKVKKALSKIKKKLMKER